MEKLSERVSLADHASFTPPDEVSAVTSEGSTARGAQSSWSGFAHSVVDTSRPATADCTVF